MSLRLRIFVALVIFTALALLGPVAAEAPGSAPAQAALARASLYKYVLTREKEWAERAAAAADRATRLDAGAPESRSSCP